MKGEYVFLTRLIPQEMEQYVYQNSRNIQLNAASTLAWHIYNGLCKNLQVDIKIFNILPVSSYPQYHKKAFIKKSYFNTTYNTHNINLGFCNIKLLRQFSYKKNMYLELKKWFKNNPQTKVVFVYTTLVAFLSILKKLKKKYNFIVCCIVPDLPNMENLSSKLSVATKLSYRHHSQKAYSLQDVVDKYVLLTKYMADYMDIKKPFCVVEGIATPISEFGKHNENEQKEKIILYAGTLHKRFGIWNLIEAFRLIKGDNYRLVLCGSGDCVEEIKMEAIKDKRIQFLGQLPRKQVLNLLLNATVVVNPRQNVEEFTRYSFPSKNLEYLSSGNPIIAYKLDGIPDEYDEYFFYVSDNSVQSLAKKIKQVCNIPKSEIEEYKKRAQKFVIEEKSETVQTKRIVTLLEANQ